MNRVNFELADGRLVTIESGERPESLTQFIANEYPTAQNCIVQNLPESSGTTELTLPLPILNFGKDQPEPERVGEEAPLSLPRFG